MSELKKVICPNCGKELEIPAELEAYSCLYCGERTELSAQKEETAAVVTSAEGFEQARAELRERLPKVVTRFPDYYKKITKKEFFGAYEYYENENRVLLKDMDAFTLRPSDRLRVPCADGHIAEGCILRRCRHALQTPQHGDEHRAIHRLLRREEIRVNAVHQTAFNRKVDSLMRPVALVRHIGIVGGCAGSRWILLRQRLTAKGAYAADKAVTQSLRFRLLYPIRAACAVEAFRQPVLCAGCGESRIRHKIMPQSGKLCGEADGIRTVGIGSDTCCRAGRLTCDL